MAEGRERGRAATGHIVPVEQRRFARKLRKEQTALEARLWRELRARRLDGWKFRRQVPIDRYIADFVCFEARLIVEVDGPLHDGQEQRLKDEQRDEVLRSEGFRILRLRGETALGRMVQEVRLALGTIAPSPGP